MEDIKAIPITRYQANKAILFVVLVAVAIFAPFLKFQPVVGSVVNATLFLSTFYLGATAGVMVGLLPSTISLVSGLLPLVLAPAIPLIILSNAILVLVFKITNKKLMPLSLAGSAVAKFAFLYATTYILAGFFTTNKILPLVVKMFGIVQLLTALGGAVIFYAVFQIARKASKKA